MKPLITSALIAASLALAGNGAMAADTYAKTGATAAPAHAGRPCTKPCTSSLRSRASRTRAST